MLVYSLFRFGGGSQRQPVGGDWMSQLIRIGGVGVVDEQQGSKLEAIERASRVLELIFSVACIGSIAAPVVCMVFLASNPTSDGPSFFFSEERGMNEVKFSDDDVREGLLNMTDKVSVCIFLSVYMGCFAACFAYAARLMGQFKQRKVFGEASVRYARGIAVSYTVSLAIVFTGVWILAFAIGDLHLDGGLIQSFFSAGLIWLFAWIIQIGAVLQTESDMTV